MTSRLRREVAVTALAAATLAADLVLSRATQPVVLGGAVACALVPWTWPRTADEKLRSRLSTTFLASAAGFAAALFASAPLGAAVVVAVAAVAAAGLAVRAQARLGGAPLPADGEVAGRVRFEGTVHALGSPQRVPGNELEVVAWVARQGRRRWASTARFEVRSADRRIALDPGQAQLTGEPWVLRGVIAHAAAAALDGANPARLVRVWSLRAGDRVYVVGRAALADDPMVATLRDPERISVFSGDALIGPGTYSGALREARARVVIAVALALVAGGVSVASRLGALG
jgi:hypothetical protein